MKIKYKAIYFPYIKQSKKRIPKNVIVAFNSNETHLYTKVKSLTSKEIREAIGIFSYNQLLSAAAKENRKITQIIRIRLAEKLLYNNKKLKRYIIVNPSKLKKWIALLKKNAKSNKVFLRIACFFENIIEDNIIEKNLNASNRKNEILDYKKVKENRKSVKTIIKDRKL